MNSESLAYWYLRLNGFLTTANFVVHPDRGPDQETDVDVIGVRFPYRRENQVRPMVDAKYFRAHSDKSLIRIVEVKVGQCALNGPWTNAQAGNMLRVLASFGLLPEPEAGLAAAALHERGEYGNQLYHIALMCFGRAENPFVTQNYPAVRQVLWPEILTFVYQRFRDYSREKSSHPQWDATGQRLWDLTFRVRNLEQFLMAVKIVDRRLGVCDSCGCTCGGRSEIDSAGA